MLTHIFDLLIRLMTKYKNSSTSFLLFVLSALLLFVSTARAQNVNLDRVLPELEPEIQRTLLAGNIPSASVALIAGDKVIWTSAYGYSNLWA